MAETETNKWLATAKGFEQLPGVRQAGLILSAAGAVAIAVALVLWAWEPNYQVLYSNLSDAETFEVIEALDRTGVDYEIEPATGAVLVPGTQVYDVRLKLAGEGLPRGDSGTGYELLDVDPGLTVSRRLEDVRHRRALEGELARSVSALHTVHSARVHLAMGSQSVFVRDREPPSASVLVNIYRGQRPSSEDVAGIVHLVASSVPGLEPKRVTVVDQTGALLSEDHRDDDMREADRRFAYTQRLERSLSDRVTEILAPVVGLEGVRAKVRADVDFTETEQTTETYDPTNNAVRSEQIEEQSNTERNAAGVPGALSNRPPDAGTLGVAQTGEEDGEPVSQSRSSTRNFELDRNISHTRYATGQLRRISVAVVVDDRREMGEPGEEGEPAEMVSVARSPEEMERLTNLVREAVGFDAERGDTVQVINESFIVPEPMVDPGDAPLWEQPWLWQAVKQVAGPMLLFVLLILVIRPTLKNLAAASPPEEALAPALPVGSEAGALRMEDQEEPERLEDVLGDARASATSDPALAAQVIKDWVNRDG